MIENDYVKSIRAWKEYDQKLNDPEERLLLLQKIDSVHKELDESHFLLLITKILKYEDSRITIINDFKDFLDFFSNYTHQMIYSTLQYSEFRKLFLSKDGLTLLATKDKKHFHEDIKGLLKYDESKKNIIDNFELCLKSMAYDIDVLFCATIESKNGLEIVNKYIKQYELMLMMQNNEIHFFRFFKNTKKT